MSPQQLVGLSESARCARLVQVFEDAYKSVSSVIVVDDIEKLIDYAPIGPRFSNVLLQALLALLNRKPPKNHKLVRPLMLYVCCPISDVRLAARHCHYVFSRGPQRVATA